MTRRGTQDGYYRQAKREGFAARSVYKLQEMDRRWRLVRPGQKVLDLGCHPGSWMQYTAKKIKKNGLVVGVDIQEPAVALPPNARFLKADLLELDPGRLRAFSDVYDLCLSDAAPRTTGITHRDVGMSLELSEKAVDLALELVKPGGAMAVKIYYGAGADDLIRKVKKNFKMGKAFRPSATTAGSKETYLVGVGLKA